MGKLPEQPVDELTKYPLPFVPDPNLPPAPEPGNENYDREIANFHHPMFRHWQLVRTPGGRAVRDSRIQWVWTWQHDAFHGTWGGLEQHFPRTEDQQCYSALVGAMGYIPDRAIAFSKSGEPLVVPLSRANRELLRLSGQVRIGNEGVRIRDFLLEYTLENGVPQVDPRLIDKFLWLADRPNTRFDRKVALAKLILQRAAEPTVPSSLAVIYKEANMSNRLRPGLPKALASFVRREIEINFGKSRLDQFVGTVIDKCADLREGGLRASTT